MKCFILFFSLSFLSHSIWGAKEKMSTKGEMQKILNSYIKLVPYAYNGKPLNDKRFLSYMEEFEAALKESSHTRFLNQSNFGPNMNIIRESAEQFKESAKMKNFYFAKRGLKTMAAKCISCHSQLPTEVFGQVNSVYLQALEKEIKSPYDQAMMAYLLRDYNLAIKKFTKAFKENAHDPQVQDRSLRKILKISFMNKSDKATPLALFKDLKKSLKKKNYLLENIDEWISQMNAFKTPPSGISLNSLVKQKLAPLEEEIISGDPSPNRVQLHYMQGVLARHMALKDKSKTTPMSLYWLGLIENSFGEDFMFSLGDMYLKNCILDYPKSKYAKKCYKALESSYTLGFTGSAGTSIPQDIKNELKNLKNKLSL